MSVEATIKKGCLVIRLGGEIDMTEAARFREEADAVLDNSEIAVMIVDMTAVDFIDSSGIGALIGRYKRLGYKNGQLRLVGLRANVQRILKLAGVLQLLNVYPDEKSALAAL